MGNENSLEGAIARFLEAAKIASSNNDVFEDVAKSLFELMCVAGKNASDIVAAGVASRSTVDRWLAGSHNPSPVSRRNLIAFFRNGDRAMNQHVDSVAGFLATVLQNERYRLAILFLVDKERLASIGQADFRRLLWFVVESAETPSFHDIEKFLG